MTKAKIDGELNIDVVCIFGSVSLITSNEVDVKATGTAMFGSTNDSVLHEVNKKSSTIYLNYTCIFGGIDIK